ncbi:hypothetical protein EDB19DRAFT_1835785 [Suillus lakei]|nr:hypothetical protein EDB19DRAFT_1835785 [Suillus lakei]
MGRAWEMVVSLEIWERGVEYYTRGVKCWEEMQECSWWRGQPQLDEMMSKNRWRWMWEMAVSLEIWERGVEYYARGVKCWEEMQEWTCERYISSRWHWHEVACSVSHIKWPSVRDKHEPLGARVPVLVIWAESKDVPVGIRCDAWSNLQSCNNNASHNIDFGRFTSQCCILRHSFPMAVVGAYAPVNQRSVLRSLLHFALNQSVGAVLLIALFSEPVRMDFISVYALANMLCKDQTRSPFINSLLIALHFDPICNEQLSDHQRHRTQETPTGAGATISVLIALRLDLVLDANIRTGIDVSKGALSFIIVQRKTKMPAAQWTTKEQYNWLQEQLSEYIALHGKDKDYAHFWAKTHLYWFKRWPEKNRGLKKEISIFETALLLKSHTKSVKEIYMDMVYDEQIKPLVKAEQEAGNISKELLEDESDEVKKEVREKYNKQKKVKKDMLDDETDDDDETNTDAIANLLHMCWTGPEAELGSRYFIISAPNSPNKRNLLLPDVEDNDKIKELEGCNNGEELKDVEELAEDGDSIDWDNTGLYIISQPPMQTDASITGFTSSSTGISDASPLGELNQSTFYSEAQFDASLGQAQPDVLFGQAQPDASLEHAWHNIATMPPNPISVLQSSVPDTIKALGWSFSHTNLMAMSYFGSDNTMQNSFPPAFGSSVPSFTDTGNTIGGRYDQYDMHTWNLTNSDSQGWEMHSLSSFLSSPISAEHSTTTMTE